MVEPHRGIYRGGKLYLEGAVPSRKVGDELKAKAAEVIGAQNVVDNYVIDPAAPAVTDGKVVVDEPFLFRTGSAAIDPAYERPPEPGGRRDAAQPAGRDGRARLHRRRRRRGDEPAAVRRPGRRRSPTGSSPRASPRTASCSRARARADPVGDNATPDGKALNRRIEVELVNLLA